jgi:hypothetical protein
MINQRQSVSDEIDFWEDFELEGLSLDDIEWMRELELNEEGSEDFYMNPEEPLNFYD